MNLWRVAIEEATGRVLAAPEPVTTPSTWSGHIAFSRDGQRMAFASLDWRSTLFKVGLDPARGAIVGTPAAVLKSTRSIRDHEISPDGQWVAYSESAPQEDVFVARTDGSQYRRLTDDPFRDRGPSWAPDGQRLAFYSDRSGSYEAWTIRVDGRNLERITAWNRVNFPVWSPDGRRIAISGVGLGGWFLIDQATRDGANKPAAEPFAEGSENFSPLSWPLQDQIVGMARNEDGDTNRIAIYSPAAKTFHIVPHSTSSTWQMPICLVDCSRLLVRDAQGIGFVNAETGAKRPLLAVRGYAVGKSMGVARDGRWLTYTETGTEGDIWLATVNQK